MSLFKNLSAFVVVLVAASSLLAEDEMPSGYEGKPENLHVYLLIGQSNMAGRAKITDKEKEIPKGVLLLNASNDWEPATHPFNQYSTIRKDIKLQNLGPGYQFAKSMLEITPDVSLGLIVNARGGSSIKEWEKGKPFYLDAVKRALIAKKSGQLKGILWHQGESDAGDKEYLSKLTVLVENLRADVGEPSLPFVAGEVNNVPLINDQIAELPNKVKHTAVVSSEKLKAYDRWHFDTASILLMGERYAKAMGELQKE
jgi:hypothetical protein